MALPGWDYIAISHLCLALPPVPPVPGPAAGQAHTLNTCYQQHLHHTHDGHQCCTVAHHQQHRLLLYVSCGSQMSLSVCCLMMQSACWQLMMVFQECAVQLEQEDDCWTSLVVVADADDHCFHCCWCHLWCCGCWKAVLYAANTS